MIETTSSPEPIPEKWDQRLEKYGILKQLAEGMEDFGISLRVVTDEIGREWMFVDMENVHMTKGKLLPKERWISLRVSADEGAGTVHMEIPLRYFIGRFSVAFAAYTKEVDPVTGDEKLTEAPKSVHSGLFNFHIGLFDNPDYIEKYSFRSDYSAEDVERRRAARQEK